MHGLIEAKGQAIIWSDFLPRPEIPPSSPYAEPNHLHSMKASPIEASCLATGIREGDTTACARPLLPGSSPEHDQVACLLEPLANSMRINP